MPPTLVSLPYQGTMAGFRRFSVAEYHQLIDIGILTEDDDLELLEGYLVHKMAPDPPHDVAIQKTNKCLVRLALPGWDVRCQCAITLDKSEPEPDFALVRGDETAYLARHPGPADIGLVIEVSDSTLPGDRDDKGRIYARAGIPIYWIVNVRDHWVEVYSAPSGDIYGKRVDFGVEQAIPLLLDGVMVGQIRGDEMLA